ncbi:CubicO group peptidase, beta-lactamase class C family [Terrimicrobium sacchariphilum]|uniref:CubicO group peptidase, beta-lactamase class C family n=1 Tax=Terrimicrobium sacchariphilum TaxID=690879 RepID=A0A146G7Z2_TERSA|nr:serine hydrolase domain-containing protein [Terrimicrobium sacchariphilum]GAT33452.1 CubicO group peptidase, beta-lactamase class C family [Terrimicrobium sacchariphilum]
MHSADRDLQALLDSYTSTGRERGLQLAVYKDGKLVVDLSSGIANVETGEKVTSHTLFPVFSVSKGIAATIVHRLVARGLLAYDEPLATWWPEFGCLGKEEITLADVLSHSAGMQNIPAGTKWADLADWSGMCRKLAESSPIFPPGTAVEYHAITYGWLVGEPACRVTGCDFPALLRREILEPLGLSELFIGNDQPWTLPISLLEEEGGSVDVPDPETPRSIPVWLLPLASLMNDPDAQRACMPASSGLATARAIARHYAALLPGGVDGVRLLDDEALNRVVTRHPPRLAPDVESGFGLGYHVETITGSTGGKIRSFGHGGHGGSKGFADIESGLAISLTKNKLSADPHAQEIIDGVRSLLG